MSLSAALDFDDGTMDVFADSTSGEARKSHRLLIGLMLIQGISAFFFLSELWSEVLGIRQTALPYEVHEVIQIFASIGLMAGMISTAAVLSQSFRRVTDLSRQVDVAAGQFQTHLQNLFQEWGLSPSERAVAIYAMKGFSNSEAAKLRGTSASTVKTQLNAVYRKSGCANRQQLMAFLVEELIAGISVE